MAARSVALAVGPASDLPIIRREHLVSRSSDGGIEVTSLVGCRDRSHASRPSFNSCAFVVAAATGSVDVSDVDLKPREAIEDPVEMRCDNRFDMIGHAGVAMGLVVAVELELHNGFLINGRPLRGHSLGEASGCLNARARQQDEALLDPFSIPAEERFGSPAHDATLPSGTVRGRVAALRRRMLRMAPGQDGESTTSPRLRCHRSADGQAGPDWLALSPSPSPQASLGMPFGSSPCQSISRFERMRHQGMSKSSRGGDQPIQIASARNIKSGRTATACNQRPSMASCHNAHRPAAGSRGRWQYVDQDRMVGRP